MGGGRGVNKWWRRGSRRGGQDDKRVGRLKAGGWRETRRRDRNIRIKSDQITECRSVNKQIACVCLGFAWVLGCRDTCMLCVRVDAWHGYIVTVGKR
jgi:hypothetical protein